MMQDEVCRKMRQDEVRRKEGRLGRMRFVEKKEDEAV